VGGNSNFPEIGGNVLFCVNRGEIQNFESMTKKGHQKFWRMRN